MEHSDSHFASPELYVVEPTCHIPVLLDEIVTWLQPAPGKRFVDGTLGGGGHTEALAMRVLSDGTVWGIDLDAAALTRCETRLAGLPVRLVAGSYTEIPELLSQENVTAVDGILLDLGLSSDQLADASRGFSFQTDGPLDLRFDTDRGRPASELVAHLDERRLADLIFQYGEERYSRRIARQIVAVRRESPIRTAQQLADLVRRCVPRSREQTIDPATRTFQALRIAVNGELDALETALRTLPDCLTVGGRLAIISFHSLEDRLVKNAFRNDSRLEVLTKRPLTASPAETAANPRARSAKLRVAQRVSGN
jgi:16S rRNA (cytosine1402-N4)-methyltransferase